MKEPMCVLQDWVMRLSLMQQAVLMTATRGPDDTPKYGSVKMLVRWYRRCVLLGAFERTTLTDPYTKGGGSFTGPSYYTSAGEDIDNWELRMDVIVHGYLQQLDALPHHFQMHFLHAAEIMGYKHPVPRIRAWWSKLYCTLVNDLHLHPESEADMDARLSDDREAWLARNNPATVE